MTLPFILLGIVAVGGVAAITAGLYLERGPAEPRDADAVFEAYFAEIGTEGGDEEIPERRFRLAHLLGHMKVSRIGRRPRP